MSSLTNKNIFHPAVLKWIVRHNSTGLHLKTSKPFLKGITANRREENMSLLVRNKNLRIYCHIPVKRIEIAELVK